jgi:acyl dehydratase
MSESENPQASETTMSAEKVTTDGLRPMTEVQIEQTREFIAGLQQGSQPYWDMVNVGDALSRELEITPELVVLYADGVEDFNPWYEGWRMNTWRIKGESPFGRAIVPPTMMSHFALSVQFDHAKPFPIGSIHTFHDSELLEPIPVGATVRITATAIEKFVKRGRRYVRHEVLVEDVETKVLYLRETRDILSM